MENKVKIISLLIVIATLTTTMAGCLNTDDSSSDTQDMIVGRWAIIDREPANLERSSQDGEPLYIVFRDNGTFYTEWGDHGYYGGYYNVNNTSVFLYDNSTENPIERQSQLYASGYIAEDNTLYLDVYMGNWTAFTLEFYN